MTRPTLERTMLDVASVLALRATCIKRSVGCVLCDDKGRILSTGYNGVAHGQPHCNEVVYVLSPQEMFGGPCIPPKYPHACPGHHLPAGSDSCQAVHAETNALLQCRDVDRIHSAYVTIAPCFRCTKELLNTGCQQIFFESPEDQDPKAKELWLANGRLWAQYPG